MQVNKDTAKRIYKEVKNVWLMQVATSADNQPWLANVFFFFFCKLNFYWLSYPGRRHSRELASNNRAAIAIAVKNDKPVIGIQAEGSVSQVASLTTISRVMPRYIKKYGAGQQFLALTKKGAAQHRLYKFEPESLQLFDELNYTPEQNPIVLLFE